MPIGILGIKVPSDPDISRYSQARPNLRTSGSGEPLGPLNKSDCGEIAEHMPPLLQARISDHVNYPAITFAIWLGAVHMQAHQRNPVAARLGEGNLGMS